MMLSKTSKDEVVSIILFGSHTTSNPQNQQEQEYYQGIQILTDIQPPTVKMLETLKQQARTQQDNPTTIHAPSNAIDAIIVAIFQILETQDSSICSSRRIIVISNLSKPIDDEGLEDELAFMDDVRCQLEHNNITLDLVLVDMHFENEIKGDSDAHEKCLAQVKEVLPSSSHIHTIHAPPHWFNALNNPHITPAPHTLVSKPMEIGSNLEIKIKVFKKTGMDPRSKDYLGIGQEAVDTGLSSIVSSKELYFAEGDPDDPADRVNEDDIIDGYMVGTEVVIVPEDIKSLMEYRAESSRLQLIGFTGVGNVPRHTWLDECWSVQANIDKQEGSGYALASLVRVVHAKGHVALFRFVNRGSIKLTAGIPVVSDGSGSEVCHFIMVALPFLDDVRDWQFASFEVEELKGKGGGGPNSRQPNQDQLDAAAQLIAAMDLDDDDSDKAILPKTASKLPMNPTQDAFLAYMAQRSLDPTTKPPDHHSTMDIAIESLLNAGTSGGTTAAALERFTTAFPLGPHFLPTTSGTTIKAAHSISSRDTAKDDFTMMMQQKSYGLAMVEMRKMIEHVVQESIMGDFEYAVELIEHMRKVAVEHRQAGSFNKVLHWFYDKFGENTPKKVFLKMLGERGVTLVSNVEVPGSEVTEEQSKEFLSLNVIED